MPLYLPKQQNKRQATLPDYYDGRDELEQHEVVVVPGGYGAVDLMHLPTQQNINTGGGRVFFLDASFGLLATASASAPVLFLGSALCYCGVSCMI